VELQLLKNKQCKALLYTEIDRNHLKGAAAVEDRNMNATFY
jgi:hypothetical protein